MAKRWWVEQGLNFGYKSMAEDPEIKKFVEAWGNLDDYNKVLLAASPRPGVKAPWSALWRTEFTKVVTEVMEGKQTSKDAVERGVQLWNTMRQDFERTKGTTSRSGRQGRCAPAGILCAMNVLDRFRLEGRVALVTGASHGIGEGIALALAGAGADVALAARGVDDLERVAGAVRDLGRQALVVPTDVSDLGQVEAMVRRTAEGLGEPEILFNVAGVNRRKPILDVSLDDWNFVLDVNLRGLYFASQAVARRLVARQAGWGRIVHIASMTSYRGFADLSLYALTKTAVISLTRSQAVEWAGQGIRVNAIAPGWIETPMTAQMNAGRRRWVETHLPQGAYGTVEDLAGMALYLASPASDYTTGQTFPVDAGFLAGNPWPALSE